MLVRIFRRLPSSPFSYYLRRTAYRPSSVLVHLLNAEDEDEDNPEVCPGDQDEDQDEGARSYRNAHSHLGRGYDVRVACVVCVGIVVGSMILLSVGLVILSSVVLATQRWFGFSMRDCESGGLGKAEAQRCERTEGTGTSMSTTLLADSVAVGASAVAVAGAGGGDGAVGIHRIWAASHNDEMQGSNALTLALSLGYGFIEVDTHLGRVTDASCVTSTSSSSTTRSKTSSTPVSSAGSSTTTATATTTKTLAGYTDELDPCLTLLAGHEAKDLNSNRTVQSLYFDPLMQRLDDNNADVEEGKWVGVYVDDPTAEVVLMIDMKEDGDALWPYLDAALQPFLSKGYLTTYNTTSSTWSHGPVRIVGTGSTPIPRVYYSTNRYIFYDAPLLTLHKPCTIPSSSSGPGTTFEWTNTLAPIASSKLPLTHYLALSPMNRNPFMCRLKMIASVAEERGIKSRWWGVARYPRWVRRRMWDLQWEAGTSVINADDLEELAVWLRAKGEKRVDASC